MLVSKVEKRGQISRLYTKDSWIDLWIEDHDPRVDVGYELMISTSGWARGGFKGYMNGIVISGGYVSFGGLLAFLPNLCLETGQDISLYYDYWNPLTDQEEGI
jgi:hypothetical protein